MLEKVHEDRVRKLEQIRAMGIDPYGSRYDTAEAIKAVVAKYEGWETAQAAAAPAAAPGEPAKSAEEAAKAAAEAAKASTAPRERGDVAGRLVLIRDMGKMIFAHVRDSSGQMQIALRKNALDEKGYALAKLLDLGDIIAVAGPLERTRTGEVTIWADRLTLLCKSLLPMPEKFHGLQDTETRYRRRYLDLMTNPDSMAVFQKRVQIINVFREVLGRRGFVEVETPVLQPIYGGAAARPFTTHHYTLDADLFLRISPELYLKRLLVGGMERVYEFSRVFRNEGIDTRHNPEFTLLELYQAYGDYEVMMEITEEVITNAAEKVWNVEEHLLKVRELTSQIETSTEEMTDVTKQMSHLTRMMRKWTEERRLESAVSASEGTKVLGRISDQLKARGDQTLQCASAVMNALLIRTQQRIGLPFGESAIDLTPPWPRRTYDELLRQHAGVSIKDPELVRAKARQLGIEEGNKDDAVVVNEVFEAAVEPNLAETVFVKVPTPDFGVVEVPVIRPVFVKDYPAGICPLTRRKADDPSVALRFELFIAGMEIANAYTELNDPTVQEANFRQQLRGEGDNAAMRILDEDFLLAQRHGMPPAGGLGIGIDRVVMLLTNTPSIRDVVLFPLLRPEKES